MYFVNNSGPWTRFTYTKTELKLLWNKIQTTVKFIIGVNLLTFNRYKTDTYTKRQTDRQTERESDKEAKSCTIYQNWCRATRGPVTVITVYTAWYRQLSRSWPTHNKSQQQLPCHIRVIANSFLTYATRPFTALFYSVCSGSQMLLSFS